MTTSVPVIGQDKFVSRGVLGSKASSPVCRKGFQNKATYRILVVDTNKGSVIDQTIVGYLTGYGYIIKVAKDHNEAFEIFQGALASEPFHLVITNLKGNERDELQEGVKDGEELIKRIKELSPDTKVLLFTASLPPVNFAGADDFLEKPCSDQARFAEKVEQLLRKV